MIAIDLCLLPFFIFLQLPSINFYSLHFNVFCFSPLLHCFIRFGFFSSVPFFASYTLCCSLFMFHHLFMYRLKHMLLNNTHTQRERECQFVDEWMNMFLQLLACFSLAFKKQNEKFRAVAATIECEKGRWVKYPTYTLKIVWAAALALTLL